MALKSDVFRDLVKAEDWDGFATLIRDGEYAKYSPKMKIYFWDFLCESKRIKEIEDCLRLMPKGHHIPYTTDDKINGVLSRDLNALIYAANSRFKHLNELAMWTIRHKLEVANYSFWPSLGGHPLVSAYMNGKGDIGRNFDKRPIFNGIIDAKVKGIEVPKALESYIVPLVQKQPLENLVFIKDIPISYGKFKPRARHASFPINYLDRACQKDDPKMLELTISTLKIKAFEYPLLGGFGLVDSMLARRSLDCLKEYLDKDPQFLIRPREFQEIVWFSNMEPNYVTGSFEKHHPIEKWIETIGEQWNFVDEEKEVKMMRMVHDNFNELLKDKADCPDVDGLRKIIEELETNKSSELFVYEVRSVFKKAFQATLELVKPASEKYPSLYVQKVIDNNVEFSSGSQ